LPAVDHIVRLRRLGRIAAPPDPGAWSLEESGVGDSRTVTVLVVVVVVVVVVVRVITHMAARCPSSTTLPGLSQAGLPCCVVVLYWCISHKYEYLGS
jgi:hypothetical protein